MTRFFRELVLPVPVADAFAYHAREGAFERLAPPWEPLRVLSRSGGIGDGGRMRARMPMLGALGPLWEAEHFDYVHDAQFRDRAVHSPFAQWDHTHRFVADGAGSRLQDDINYRLPLGAVGDAVAGRLVGRRIARMFDYRHAVTAQDLSRHAQFTGTLRVAITGASGLIGTALGRFLTLGGHTVLPLVRRRGAAGIFWDPQTGEIDAAALEGVDAVVHLAGEGIADGRWTPEFRQRVLQSRTAGTALIAKTIAGLQSPPRVLISASAVGYYGDRGDELLDETSPPGTLFLSDICTAWEAAAEPARTAGIRVVHPRIGLVLSPFGGALPELMRPLRLGVSAQFGAGRQWQSWIGLDDTVYAIHHAIFTQTVRGPMNAVAPTPLRQHDLVAVLARVMHRPAIGAVPRFAARALFGKEKADELFFAGQRVVPKALLESGFAFWHSELEAMLRHVLGRTTT